MKKKMLLSLLMLLLSTVAMVNSMVQPKKFESEITQLLTAFAKAAQKGKFGDLPSKIKAIYLKINPTDRVLSEEELALEVKKLPIQDQENILRHGRDTIFKAVHSGEININYKKINYLFDTIFEELHKRLMSEDRPLTACGYLAQAACIGLDGQVIFPGITKVAKFLALVEEFFDLADAAKPDTQPIAYYFNAWMDLMEDENGRVLPGLEKLYAFLDTNKTQRRILDLIANFNNEFPNELNKPYEFLKKIIFSLLELNPNAPLAEYADKILPLMIDKNGQVKPELKEVYQFVRNNRNTKDVVKFIREFEKLNRPAQQKDVFSKYQEELALLKKHFIEKYPIARLPKDILARRIAANIKYLNKLKAENITLESRKASTTRKANAAKSDTKPTTYTESPIQEIIQEIIYKTLKQHSNSLGESFADNEGNIIKELWIGHIAGTTSDIQAAVVGEGNSFEYSKLPKAIIGYIGTSLDNLPTRLSESMQIQIKALQNIIIKEMEKVSLTEEQKKQLAHTMAVEIINGTIYALVTNLSGPYIYTTANQGYEAIQLMATDLTRLKSEFYELSNKQKLIITDLTRKIKEAQDESQNKQSLEQELKTAQDQKKYLDTVYLALSLKLGIVNTAYWIATSKLAWPIRFTAKTGYKVIRYLS